MEFNNFHVETQRKKDESLNHVYSEISVFLNGVDLISSFFKSKVRIDGS